MVRLMILLLVLRLSRPNQTFRKLSELKESNHGRLGLEMLPGLACSALRLAQISQNLKKVEHKNKTSIPHLLVLLLLDSELLPSAA